MIGIIRDEGRDFGDVQCRPTDSDRCFLQGSNIKPEQLEHLSTIEREEHLLLVDQYADYFTDLPGLCELVTHEINMTSDLRPQA